MEQLVILLLIALISFINWLVKKSAQLREARKLEEGMAKTGESLRGHPPPKLEPPESEPSFRRLKEALGLPDEALPPALPRRTRKKIPPDAGFAGASAPSRSAPGRFAAARCFGARQRPAASRAPGARVSSGARWPRRPQARPGPPAFGNCSARRRACAMRWCCLKSLANQNACVPLRGAS